jgi:hypothetical protein
MLAVVYKEKKDAIYGENIEWKTSTLQNKKDFVEKKLFQCGFSNEKNKEIFDILNFSNKNNFFDVGVRERTNVLNFFFNSWSSKSGKVVLVGDSAHAM